MEASKRIGESSGLIGDGGGDPGMRQLQQQRAAGAEENRCLPVDSPCHGGRTKDTLAPTTGPGPDDVEAAFEVLCGDQHNIPYVVVRAEDKAARTQGDHDLRRASRARRSRPLRNGESALHGLPR